MWGTVLKRDLLGEIREEDRFHSRKQVREYLRSEIKKQGENVVIRDLDVSLVEDLHDLFINSAYEVKSLDLSGWKTSGAKNMAELFNYCPKLESLNVSGWDVSNVENMCAMFYDCKNLKSLDLSGWNVSNVKDMGWMFYNCYELKSLDLSGWDTSKVKNMSWMFKYCPAPYEVVNNKIIKKNKNNLIIQINPLYLQC